MQILPSTQKADVVKRVPRPHGGDFDDLAVVMIDRQQNRLTLRCEMKLAHQEQRRALSQAEHASYVRVRGDCGKLGSAMSNGDPEFLPQKLV